MRSFSVSSGWSFFLDSISRSAADLRPENEKLRFSSGSTRGKVGISVCFSELYFCANSSIYRPAGKGSQRLLQTLSILSPALSSTVLPIFSIS